IMIELLDRFPTEGESVVTDDGITLTAKKVDNNRIETVTILLAEPETVSQKKPEDNSSSDTNV
ncbi:MAG: hemolysin, partial [Lachnospiraceae bacterium]|nr:hemolysin [Lachnospiraceae bacterium]